MSTNENEKVRKPRRNYKRERAIKKITQNASKGGENKVAKKLTFNQAYSIYLRSRQLIDETEEYVSNLNNARDKQIEEQIERCWRDRQG